jgi:inhibitor of KinA
MSSAPPAEALRVAAAGDAALVLEFPSRIDPAVNARVTAIAAALRARWSAILRDVVVGYCTVTVHFDPLQVDGPWLESELRAAARDHADVAAGEGRVVEVPVCYDEDLAPDLAEVAAYGQCAVEDVIGWHCAVTYRVYMLGFVPGFAYLAEVDPRIARPRRGSPRTAVPAGSVAIAGPQTGIYPATTPGGWNIIGRTPLDLYDPQRTEPCLLRAGDAVRFVRISRDQFQEVR